MFPLRDENPTERVPVITVLLIAVNVFVFVYQWTLPQHQLIELWRTWGFIPVRFLSDPVSDVTITFFTCMFLHGGLLHLLGNMLYLWVFGDNVEDELGHVPFLVFYLAAGIAGSVLQVVIFPSSDMPLIGASGAIAGVLGGYLLLYPQARILTVLIIVIIIRLVYLPAWILLGFWIFLQFFQGSLSMGLPQAGGVAWFAHVGGFGAGAVMIFFLKIIQRRR